jgi:type IV pilus assembly protein PilQ
MRAAYRRVFRIGMPETAVLVLVSLALWAAGAIAAMPPNAQANASEAVGSLGEPKVSQEHQTTIVELPVSATVSYTSRKANDPERIVVDLPGVDAQKISSRFPGNADLVDEIRIQAQPTAENKPYTVVELILRRPADYRIEKGAEGLRVTFSAEENKKADTISRIQAEDVLGKSMIRISGNGKFTDYEVRKLSNNRLAVDIANVKSPARQALIPTPSTVIKRLYVDGSKDSSTTITADFSSAFGEYSVDNSGNCLVLNVGTRMTAAKGKSAPVKAEPEVVLPISSEVRDDSVKFFPPAEVLDNPINPVAPAAASTNVVPPVIFTAASTHSGSGSAFPVPAPGKKANDKTSKPLVTPLIKTFTGKPISLDLQEADIKNVLRLLADVSGANIVIEPDVAGKVTLKVNRVPWDQVLDMILAMNNLGQEQSGGVIRIARQDKLKKELSEKEAELKARQQVIESAKEMGDITTNYLQVNYAMAAKIASKIERMKSPKGKITVDDRTNLILYSDYPAFIQSARELIGKLDLPTPQVLIESRIVQLNTNAIRDLGIQWSFNINSLDKTGSHRLTSDFAINHAVAASSLLGFGFGQIVGRNLYQLDIQLSATEQAGKGKVVSAPRVLTLDNAEATIIQGQQIPYRKLNEFGVVTTEFKDATLELKVTPHITPDQKVRLEIKAKKEQANFTQQIGPDAAPAIDTRRVNTELLVADGDTIVIGGVIEETENYNEGRTPGLSQVPIIGGMFKNEQYQKTKSELLIFISPRITGMSVPIRTNKEIRGPSLGASLPGNM